ncbi:MAG: hypothetical protein H7840_08280 [Alphaproteobacteria bacterium]
MIVIGLNIGHDASATVIEDGTVLVCAEAERVVDDKHAGLVDNALIAVVAALDDCGIGRDSVDAVCVCDMIGYPGLEQTFPLIRESNHRHPYVSRIEISTDDTIEKVTAFFSGTPVYACCHSFAHATGALYMSGLDDCNVIVSDGYGSCCASMALRYRDSTLTILDCWPANLMLGLRYAQFGWFVRDIRKEMSVQDGQLYAGASVHDFPGKIMGLHSYGEVADKYVNDFIEWFTNSDIDVYFRCFGTRLKEHPPVPGLSPDNIYNKLSLDCLLAAGKQSLSVVASMQEAFSRVTEEAVRRVTQATGVGRIVLTGGCGLNVITNERVSQLPEVSTLFVPPNCDDRGTSMGAAALLYCALAGTPLHFPQIDLKRRRSPYQGLPLIADDEDLPGISGMDFPLDDAANLARLVSWLVDDAWIVGLVQGRSEIGPRALGNRSMIAMPTHAWMKDKINQNIKNREWWRPFAPVTREDDYFEYFSSSRADPYMLTGAMVRAEYVDRLAAITHVDGTARVQCLQSRDANPVLWDLLTAIKERTGVGVLLNTSYNAGGKPLVNRASRAIALLNETRMDALWMESRLYRKSRER